MGALVSDPSVPQIAVVLNNRFAPGDPLREMIAIQKEFDVFSPEHSIARICSLLTLARPEDKDARGWSHIVNLSRSVMEAAQRLWQDATRANFSIGSACRHVADYSLASGVFNVKLHWPTDA